MTNSPPHVHQATPNAFYFKCMQSPLKVKKREQTETKTKNDTTKSKKQKRKKKKKKEIGRRTHHLSFPILLIFRSKSF